MGGLGVIVSLSLSAVLWTLLLPLALGAITTLIPSLMSAITWVAQVPFVAATLGWFSSLPVVTTSMVWVNSLFATVGSALVTAFGPAIGALATLISVQVPAVVLVVGTTLGLLVTPVAAILSWVADGLSNHWAIWQWKKGGPLTWVYEKWSAGENTESLFKGPDHGPGFGSSKSASFTHSSIDDAASRTEEVALLQGSNRKIKPHVLKMTREGARELLGDKLASDISGDGSAAAGINVAETSDEWPTGEIICVSGATMTPIEFE